jgi:hypothetical protein
MARTTSEILSRGLEDVLASWQAHGGERDPFYWIVKLQAARALGGESTVLAALPPTFAEQLGRRHREIVAYFDNVRYALLDPLAQVWGTVVNALRVAAGVSTVTAAQKRAFEVPLESLAGFFRAAHDHTTAADQLYEAFRPMPAPDCQALAALLHPNANLDGRNIVGLMRMLSAEGPLTAEETEALNVLASSGLSAFAFQGSRRGG